MTTNGEWLFSKPFDEQVAWMNAEHQDGTLDGDTEPENADSRERLEAEIESYSAFDMMDTITLDMVIGWLDRQAAITERECRKPNWSYCETCEALEKLTAERERYREKFGKCLDYADAIHALMDDEGMA